MGVGHYVAALLVIAALNWAGGRFGSRPANKLIFLATAGAPIVLCLGLIGFLLFRDGPATLQSPHFSTLLMVVVASTIATCAVALLGQALGRRRSRRQL